MDGWTGTGQKIQPLSKQCRSYVKGLSKKRSHRGFVQFVSKSGQSSVKPVSISRSFGQRLDVKIHCSSKLCPHEFIIMPIFALDGIWTYFGPGKNVQGSHFELLKYQNWMWTETGQTLDMDILWTKCGLLPKTSVDPWPANYLIDKLWTNTKHGQTLDEY